MSRTFKFDLKPSPELNVFSEYFKKVGIREVVVKTFTPQPLKKFARKQLFSDFIARSIEASSLTLTLRGNALRAADDIDFRIRMKKFGFKIIRVKQSDYRAANRFYMKEELEINKIRSSEASKGNLVLLLLQTNLLDLFKPGPCNIKELEKILAFTEEERDKRNNSPKKRKAADILPWEDYYVQSAFVKDTGKNMPYVWFYPSEFKFLCDNLSQLASGTNEFDNLEVHNLFHNDLVGTLQASMSQVVSPLEKSLQMLPSKLDQVVQQLPSTLEVLKHELEKS